MWMLAILVRKFSKKTLSVKIRYLSRLSCWEWCESIYQTSTDIKMFIIITIYILCVSTYGMLAHSVQFVGVISLSTIWMESRV